MGWSTARMDRLYTDVISSEDRRAADHMGVLLDDGAECVVDRSPEAEA
jgi:hypothetical protein